MLLMLLSVQQATNASSQGELATPDPPGPNGSQVLKAGRNGVDSSRRSEGLLPRNCVPSGLESHSTGNTLEPLKATPHRKVRYRNTRRCPPVRERRTVGQNPKLGKNYVEQSEWFV